MERSLSTILAYSGIGQTEKAMHRNNSVPEIQPVYMSSAFAFDDIESVEDIYTGKTGGYVYSRMKHPNSDEAARVIAGAEGAEDALVFASGMAAIVLSIISTVKAGDHVVAASVLYGAVHDFLANELARFGVSVTFADFADIKSVERAMRPETKLVYTETIANPLMTVSDISALAELAHGNGVLLFTDNTFATPVVARPLRLGADLSIYSATKYLGGHSDLIGGAAAGSAELIAAVRKNLVLYGATLGAAESWLLERSLRTLDLRVRRQSENAMKMAEFLSGHPAVARVCYPGLSSDPCHETAGRLFEDGLYGGMLSAEIRGGGTAVSEFVKNLGFILYVPSLAGTATTISYPVQTSHRAYSAEERAREGISDGLVRFSAGIEDEDDILKQLGTALDAVLAMK